MAWKHINEQVPKEKEVCWIRFAADGAPDDSIDIVAQYEVRPLGGIGLAAGWIALSPLPAKTATIGLVGSFNLLSLTDWPYWTPIRDPNDNPPW